MCARRAGGPKPNDGVRPIAMGGTLVKIVEKCLLAETVKNVNLIFPSYQFGVSKSFGSEQVAHEVRRWYEKGKHILSLDVKNAFNSIGRECLFKAVLERVPSLLNYFLFSYGQDSPLMIHTPDEMEELSSKEGVRQGAPLSSFFFCLGIQSLLEGLDIDGVEGICYADDMQFCCSDLHSLELVYHRLSFELKDVHLILRPDKSKLLRRDGDDGDFDVDGVEEAVW